MCVVEKLGTYCGNSLLEDGEECDGGDSMKLGNDGCCNMDCTLRDGAICRSVACLLLYIKRGFAKLKNWMI